MTLLAILFWVHLLGMSVWVGASLLMPLAIGPALQGVDAPTRMKAMAAISQRLTPLVFVSIFLVFASGLWQTVIRYGGFGIYMSVNPLTIKVWVAVLMFANGTYLGIFLPRRIAAAAPPPGAPPSPQFLRLQRSLAGHSWAQFAMAVIVLLLVGMLTG